MDVQRHGRIGLHKTIYFNNGRLVDSLAFNVTIMPSCKSLPIAKLILCPKLPIESRLALWCTWSNGAQDDAALEARVWH